MPKTNQYDELLADDGPAALIFEQPLRAVDGDIVFPPTYANPSQKKGDPPVYNMDNVGTKEEPKWLCTIDSIQAQNNRIEPALGEMADGKLVPQVTVKAMQEIGGEKEEVTVNLLDAGHRAADALVRFSPEVRKKITAAFAAIERGRDFGPLAKLNPTALVFGVWDSRESGVKVPRLLNSVIRGEDCVELTRSAQYFPALTYNEAGVPAEEGEAKASTQGLAGAMDVHALGGVRVRGGITRRGSLNLVSLRNLLTGDETATLKLQRYILGLALVALTHFDGKCLNLRQGCQLVAVEKKAGKREKVMATGETKPFEVSTADALAYATTAAEAFFAPDGVREHDLTADFDPTAAKAALATKKGKGKSDAEAE